MESPTASWLTADIQLDSTTFKFELGDMDKVEIRRRLHQYSLKEELVTSISCWLGVCLSLVGVVLLIVATARQADLWLIVSCGLYGVTLLISYVISALYHSIQQPHYKYWLRVLDHIGIFLLIAGTYTPFALGPLRGVWGWSLFCGAWTLAAAGGLLKVFMTHRLKILGPLLYIGMGWIVVLMIKPLLAVLPLAGFWWLLSGGVIYTLGVIFYALDKIPYNHSIWHLFVLGGSVCHFWAIYFYVVPL